MEIGSSRSVTNLMDFASVAPQLLDRPAGIIPLASVDGRPLADLELSVSYTHLRAHETSAHL
eukprot:11814570-Alexandrium_andersonii.AAC.1